MKRDKAWRLHQENRVIHNRLEIIKQVDPRYAKECEKEPHRLSKKHPLDCGNSQCKLCHPEKYYEDGNHKDYHYYKQNPQEMDDYLLEPPEDYEDNYDEDEEFE